MTYEIIRRNYERGLWNERQVRVAVMAGVITKEQAVAICAGTPASVMKPQAQGGRESDE